METLTRKEIEGRVKSIIMDKLNVSENEVTLDASLSNDLGSDSLDSVEIIMDAEREFNIKIYDEYTYKMSTVEDIITYTDNYLNKDQKENFKHFRPDKLKVGSIQNRNCIHTSCFF